MIYEKGRGKNKIQTFDEKYICTLCQSFYRLASKLGTLISAMSNHIEVDYKCYKDEGEKAYTNQVK
jgi:hypothetical protein